MRTSTGLALVGSLLLGACGAECPGSAELAARIEALASGEHLALGECVVAQSVSVPAGAIVEGGRFELPVDGAITLEPSADGAAPTTLRGASVRGSGRGARVRVSGPGAARLAEVSITLEGGIGVAVSGADASLEALTIAGDVDPARVIELPSEPGDDLARYGVAVIDGGAIALTGGSSISAVASAAIVCSSATLDASGTVLSANLGFGVQAFGCAATLTDVEVHGTLAAPGLPGVGIAVVAGSSLQATRLSLHDAPGIGVLVRASDAVLVEPAIARLEQAGAWAEEGASLRVERGTLSENAGAAIAAVGASALGVEGTRIERTGRAPIVSGGGGGAETMADAIHVVQSAAVPCAVSIADVTAVENDRVGLLVDGDGAPVSLAIVRTRVETSGTQLGALAQNVAALPPGWDADVTRVGSAATLDATAGPQPVSSTLSARVILMPPTIVP